MALWDACCLFTRRPARGCRRARPAPLGGAEARLRDAHLTDQVLANRADPSLILGPAGLSVRGHEFHYSTVDPVPDRVERTWRLRRSDGATRIEGY